VDIDRLIDKRHTERVTDEGERAREALWQESVRRYHEKEQQDHRAAWCEHWRKMRAVHYGLGDEYDQKLRALENGHHENGTKGDAA
jgi:hypothetical protein